MFEGLIHEDPCPKFTSNLKVKSIYAIMLFLYDNLLYKYSLRTRDLKNKGFSNAASGKKYYCFN